ncbi:MAG TPA: hypothetical protein DCP11_08480 [Microbacteriaceae bacterium]|jgi:hypothetical protein|nr:hypothetical protein [Microbacteriaceae bacterium]
MFRLAAAPLVIVLTNPIVVRVHSQTLGGGRMASSAAIEAYDNLAIGLRGEDGVEITPEGLLVHGTLFAFLQDDDLVVELTPARASDLVHRGVAARFVVDGHPTREWVRVSNLQLWPELAGEAHEFVGEPPVGGQS